MRFIHLRIVRVNVKMTTIVNFGFGMDPTILRTETRVGLKQAIQKPLKEWGKYLDQNVAQVNINRFFV